VCACGVLAGAFFFVGALMWWLWRSWTGCGASQFAYPGSVEAAVRHASGCLRGNRPWHWCVVGARGLFVAAARALSYALAASF
jgi:hypothetical protein